MDLNVRRTALQYASPLKESHLSSFLLLAVWLQYSSTRRGLVHAVQRRGFDSTLCSEGCAVQQYMHQHVVRYMLEQEAVLSKRQLPDSEQHNPVPPDSPSRLGFESSSPAAKQCKARGTTATRYVHIHSVNTLINTTHLRPHPLLRSNTIYATVCNHTSSHTIMYQIS